MINIDAAIKRIGDFKSLKTQKEIAPLFNLSESDFSNRKGRGTLYELFIDWAFHESVNLEWLFYGRGSIKLGDESSTVEHLKADHDKILKGIGDIKEKLKPANELPVQSKKKTAQQLK